MTILSNELTPMSPRGQGKQQPAEDERHAAVASARPLHDDTALKAMELGEHGNLGGGIPLLGDRCGPDRAHALVLTLFVVLTGEQDVVAGLDRLE